MSNSIQEKIATNLKKIKEQGGTRIERIREIVRVAVVESIAEVRGGSGEVRQIARDAVSTVIADLKTRGQASPEEVSAPIAGAIAGIQQADPSELPPVKVEQLFASEEQIQEVVPAEAESALVVSEIVSEETASTQRRSRFTAILTGLRDRQLPELQQQMVRLQEQMTRLDEKLNERYGDRYTQVKHQVKQRFADAKVWYNDAKAKAEVAQVSPVDRTQADLQVKAAEAGVAAAQFEQNLKQRIKTYLQTAIDRF